MKKGYGGSGKAFTELETVVKRLRGPGGCPWDRKQNHKTLVPYAIEEVYELVEALEGSDTENMIEELGDVLFQVVLHAQLLKEKSKGDLREVVQNVTEKMIRRHPHVFGKGKAKTPREVMIHWEKIKKAEKKPAADSFSVPRHLPALQRAQKIGEKTRKVGFDWKNANQVFEKVSEELREFKGARKKESSRRQKEEFGDLLFTLVQVGRHMNWDVEGVLRATNQKFERRFFSMLKLSKTDLSSFEKLTDAQKEKFWEKAKRGEKKKRRV